MSKKAQVNSGVGCGKPRLADLKAVLEGGARMLILTHDNPDPDALASAFALLKLAETFDGLTARIGFGGFRHVHPEVTDEPAHQQVFPPDRPPARCRPHHGGEQVVRQHRNGP